MCKLSFPSRSESRIAAFTIRSLMAANRSVTNPAILAVLCRPWACAIAGIASCDSPGKRYDSRAAASNRAPLRFLAASPRGV
eukprot:13962809-Alexandrium_andersonii.AAC.1